MDRDELYAASDQLQQALRERELLQQRLRQEAERITQEARDRYRWWPARALAPAPVTSDGAHIITTLEA